MKRKVGTVLEEELLFRAKELAILQKRPLSQVFEEALRSYLARFQGKKGVVGATRGVMDISSEALGAVMEEEGVFGA